jgi:protein-S-isoprenylcysteine O-methyltransferase Ste14
MQATPFEYRFRFWIHASIFVLGFFSPWLLIAGITDVPGFTTRTTWLVLSALLARTGLLNFGASTLAILALGILFAGLGAWLRTWGSAYVGASIVQSTSMHGNSLLADGPYRRTRNPLYLGTLLHAIGISIVMPPSGAIFTIVAIWIFQVRLALAEEPFLAARFGEPYSAYKSAVPRFLPSLKPLVPSAEKQPHWLPAILGESYMIGVFVTLAAFGWSFNAQPLRQGILISLGLSLVVRAFLPRATTKSIEAI